jgi:hypothetical protein
VNSALDGGEWSASRPSLFTPQGKSFWYPLDRRLGGPQSRPGRGGEEKNSQPLLGLEPPIIQPVAQRYTTELSRLLKIRNSGVCVCVCARTLEFFSSHHCTQIDSVVHSASFSMGTGVKRPGREAYHESPSSVEVKNEWNYTFAPPVRSYCVVLN